MEVVIHLPDDVVAAMPWEDVPRHLVEQIALEGYQEGWLGEEQVCRPLGYDTRLDQSFAAFTHHVASDGVRKDNGDAFLLEQLTDRGFTDANAAG